MNNEQTLSTDLQETKDKFEQVVQSVLPEFYSKVFHRKSFYGDYLGIFVACSDKKIHNVENQYPQLVSLMFDLKTEELTVQIFGCMGGNRIFTIPQKNLYLAMEAVKIPFRKSKGIDASLKTLGKFLQSYKATLIQHRDILKYSDLVDYSKLLNN